MRQHLDTCAACRRTVAAFESAWEVAVADAACAVPPELTARAMAVFEVRQGRDWIAPLRELACKLVFDSNSLDLLPSGVRSVSPSAGSEIRQLTYQAGDYEVDLHVEPHGSAAAEIVGQIAHRRPGGAALEGLLVQVLAGGKTVGETETNQFGEFVLARPAKPAVVVRIAIQPESSRIDLPIGIGKRR